MRNFKYLSWIRIAVEVLVLSLVVLVAIPQAQTALSRSIAWFSTGHLIFDGTAAPTVQSGFGTSPSITSSNGSTTFRLNIGTGGNATSGILTMPTAFAGWNCQISNTNATSPAFAKQTTTTTTTITVAAFAGTGGSTPFIASDILYFNCAAF